MKILITGGSSLLGKALLETAPKEHQIEATWYSNYVGRPMYQMDVCNQSQVSYVVNRIQPNVIIHCATVTSVDFAQENYTQAYKVAVGGTENLLRAAWDMGAKFIFPSTNAVFSGERPPYSEHDERHPVNSYGSIRRQSEDVVTAHIDWLIVRLFLLYGWPWPGGRRNWATRTVERLGRDKGMRMVNDKVYQPTYALDAAGAIWRLLATGREGVFHVASDNQMTLYEFCVEVAKIWGLDAGLIEPVGSEAYPNIAPRPADSSYDLAKIHGLGIQLHGVREGLRLMRERGPE